MKNKSNQTTQALMNNPANLMPVKVSEIQRYRDQCKALTGKTIVPAMILHGELIPAHELGSISHMPYRSEEHTSELQSLMRISYAVFCLKKNINKTKQD